VELQVAVLTSGSLMTTGSDLGLTGLDLSSGIFLLLKIDLWCRSMTVDTKHRPFFYSSQIVSFTLAVTKNRLSAGTTNLFL
jgi:hypothetical protein